jgi:hypothetical protein
VQKLETVANTYLAAAGLQNTRQDHAVAMAELCEDALIVLRNCIDRLGQRVVVKFGINTGRVHSGVVGLKRPQFSLFGDTVNTASRMCSTGLDDRIHVSEATADFLRPHYVLEPRQTMVKGKGLLSTFLLGARVTKRKRTHELLKPADDMIEELNVFIKKVQMRESEEIDQSDMVPLDPFTLSFPETLMSGDASWMMEDKYVENWQSHIGNQVRVPVALSILFFLGEAGIEVSMFPSAAKQIFGIRAVFVGCAILFSALLSTDKFRQHFSRHARLYISVVFFIGATTILLTRLSYLASFDQVLLRPVVSLIFLNTLICNSGIRFIDAIAYSISAVVLEAVLGYKFATADSPSMLATALFWNIAGSVINLVSSYGREMYHRRVFVLKERVQQEKNHADSKLFKMLPISVAQTLKENAASPPDQYECPLI